MLRRKCKPGCSVEEFEELRDEVGELRAECQDGLDDLGNLEDMQLRDSQALRLELAAVAERMVTCGEEIGLAKKRIRDIVASSDMHAEQFEEWDSARQHVIVDIESRLSAATQAARSVQFGMDNLTSRVDMGLERVDADLAAVWPRLEERAAELAEAAATGATATLRAELAALGSALREESAAQEHRLAVRLKSLEAAEPARQKADDMVQVLQQRLSALEVATQKWAHDASQVSEELNACLRKEMATGNQVVRQSMCEMMEAAAEAHDRRAVMQAARIDDVEAGMERCRDAIQRYLDEQQIVRDEAAKEREIREANENCRFSELLSDCKECQARLVRIEDATTQLRVDCAKVAGSWTRKVEWLLDDATLNRLCEPEALADATSPKAVASKRGVEVVSAENPKRVFSPTFEVAGAGGLQLELVFHPPQSPNSCNEVHGDCSLYLWADKGLELLCRVFAGDESAVLRHTFDGLAPAGVGHICWLSEQLRSPCGSLRAGIEVFEAWRTFDCEEAAENDTAKRPQGKLLAKQYLNHRMLDICQKQGQGIADLVQRKVDVAVDVIRSRAVRRVQWRLEDAHLLRRQFAKGQSICSTAFEAAGIIGMQLIFYPNGCKATREDFCALFLSCPAGYTVRCWLWAGRWRKEARSEPSGKQSLFGRVNFCRFDSCVEPVGEGVEIALEIEEVQLTQEQSHDTASEVTSTQDGRCSVSRETTSTSNVAAQSPAGGPNTVADRGAAALDRSDVSTSKVERLPGKLSPNQVKQLPSVWTSHGFQTFKDLREIAFPKCQNSDAGSRAIVSAADDSGAVGAAAPAKRLNALVTSGTRRLTPRRIAGFGSQLTS